MNINGNALWPNVQFFLNGNNLNEGNLEEEEEEEENLKELENFFQFPFSSPLREENNLS